MSLPCLLLLYALGAARACRHQPTLLTSDCAAHCATTAPHPPHRHHSSRASTMVLPSLFVPVGLMFVASRSSTSPAVALCQRASRNFASSRSTSACAAAAISSLPPLLSKDGSASPVDSVSLPDTLAGKRVALYFAAGWCPMCTSFEPSLLQFREAAQDSDKPLEIIYVPSDRTEADAAKRAAAMGMMSVPVGEDADAIKKQYKIWSGAESMKLGFGRRSGVPALVVLGKEGTEMEFLAAEAEGVKALSSWPLDDADGVW